MHELYIMSCKPNGNQEKTQVGIKNHNYNHKS